MKTKLTTFAAALLRAAPCYVAGDAAKGEAAFKQRQTAMP